MKLYEIFTLIESDSVDTLSKKIYNLKEYIGKIKIDTNITIKNNKTKQISAYGKSIKKSMGAYTIILDHRHDGVQVEAPLESMGMAKLRSILSQLEKLAK